MKYSKEAIEAAEGIVYGLVESVKPHMVDNAAAQIDAAFNPIRVKLWLAEEELKKLKETGPVFTQNHTGIE